MAELWQDIAQWRGPSPNVGGPMLEYRGLVVHIAQGSFEGTISWCKNPDSDVSTHFVVALDGRIAQVVPVDVTAWTQRDGNGHWISVENEGYTPNSLTPAQVDANARIFAKCHKVKGVPLQLATSPSGRGLGHHSMGAENGYNWGHSECPGPAIKNQKPEILARAVQIVNGIGGTTMAQMLIKNTADGQLYLVDGMLRRKVTADQVNAGAIANTGVHQAGLLGPLGNSGQVFNTSGDMDVWGALYPPPGVSMTDAQLAEVTAAAAQGASNGTITLTGTLTPND